MTEGSNDEVRAAVGSAITPLDIQQKEFRVSRFGGYRMRDVDEFLDKLTGLVQGHAETVKGMARSARRPDQTSTASTASTGSTKEAPAAPTGPEDEEPPSPPPADKSDESDEGPVDDVVDVVDVEDAEATQSLPAAKEHGELAQTRPTASGRGSDR